MNELLHGLSEAYPQENMVLFADNAGWHKSKALVQPANIRIELLPPYSPELNRIEILWKHAKHLWRRFVARNGADLLDEIQSLMRGFGSTFTINFA